MRVCRIVLRRARETEAEEGTVHRLWERRTGGETVGSERGGVAATPVLDDVASPRAPQGAHGGLLQELREGAEKRVSVREPGLRHQNQGTEHQGSAWP